MPILGPLSSEQFFRELPEAGRGNLIETLSHNGDHFRRRYVKRAPHIRTVRWLFAKDSPRDSSKHVASAVPSAKSLRDALRRHRLITWSDERGFVVTDKTTPLDLRPGNAGPRHCVNFELIPADGTYQYVYILGQFGSPDEDRMFFFNPYYFGPFLIRYVGNESVAIPTYPLYIEDLDQTRGDERWMEDFLQSSFTPMSDSENPVWHTFAEGFLREGDRTTSYTRHSMFYADSWGASVERINDTLVSLDAAGDPEPSLALYQYMGGSIDNRVDPIPCGECAVLAVGSTGDVVGMGAAAGLFQWGMSWNPDGTLQDYLTIELIPPIRIDPITRTASGNMRVGRLDSSGKQVEKVEAFSLFTIAPVSRAIVQGPQSDDVAFERVSACLPRLERDIRGALKETPRDGDYLSAQKAVDEFQRLRINGIAFVKDLVALKGFLVPLLKLIKSKGLSPKAWADVLLWWKYGVKLTARDARMLASTLPQTLKVISSFREWLKYQSALQSHYGTHFLPIESLRFSGTHRSNSRVVARHELPDSEHWSQVGALLNELDLRLTMENLWDLVPFSFVVDWFVNIGELATQLDYSVLSDQLKLREWVYSSHNIVTPHPRTYLDLGFGNGLRIDTYTRSVTGMLPEPPFETGPAEFAKHCWELELISLSKWGKR